MVAKLSMMVEIDDDAFEKLGGFVYHHIEYIVDLESNYEIKSVWDAKLEKVQEEM